MFFVAFFHPRLVYFVSLYWKEAAYIFLGSLDWPNERSTLISMLVSTEKVGFLQAGQRHIFPFSSVHTQASENKEVYLVEDCSIKSCNDGVNIISESMPSFSFSLPALPVVSRPQANHPHVEIDSVCLPSVPVSSRCVVIIFFKHA